MKNNCIHSVNAVLCSFFFLRIFKIYLIYFIFYFWLCWVFVAVRGLVASGGATLRCGAWASYC